VVGLAGERAGESGAGLPYESGGETDFSVFTHCRHGSSQLIKGDVGDGNGGAVSWPAIFPTPSLPPYPPLSPTLPAGKGCAAVS